ncbi:hypothetical protein V5G24_20045 [Xanthobacter sp. VTT E-85241]|uniref:hypothetical protein n=1 Tax=Roseixanthobacter finlandensis TaxID=3119922 RepID=UPI00372844E2
MRGTVNDRLTQAFRRYFGVKGDLKHWHMGDGLWRVDHPSSGAWAEFDDAAGRLRRVSESGPGKEGQKQ